MRAVARLSRQFRHRRCGGLRIAAPARVAVGYARRSSEAHQLTSQRLIEAHASSSSLMTSRPRRRKDRRNKTPGSRSNTRSCSSAREMGAGPTPRFLPVHPTGQYSKKCPRGLDLYLTVATRGRCGRSLLRPFATWFLRPGRSRFYGPTVAALGNERRSLFAG